MKKVTPADRFPATQEKIASFRAGFGTILYFTETQTVHKLEADFPLYAANFANWAEQGLGGAQQAVWTSLAAENIGASLQHYNPLIDEKIKEALKVGNYEPKCHLVRSKHRLAKKNFYPMMFASRSSNNSYYLQNY